MVEESPGHKVADLCGYCVKVKFVFILKNEEDTRASSESEDKASKLLKRADETLAKLEVHE